jgi:branched-chain amino acid transport system substrate-binding protein
MKSRMYLVIVAAILASILLGACGAAEPTEPAAEPTTAPATGPTTAPKPGVPAYIEIGSSIPLTGKYGSLGAMVKPGYEYAVADINAAGGIYVEEYDANIPIRLTLYDDESDPTKTVSKMETLFSDDNVVAYLGGAGSDMHAAAAPIAEKNKVPYLGIAFALYSIHQQGYNYLFSPFPKSPDQARDVFEALNTIPEAERPSKVAVFQEKTDWGIELWELWQQYADEYGYEIVVHEEYAPRSEDFSAMIIKAKDAEAEVLLSVPNPPDGLAIQKQMAELGWTPKFSLMIRAPENVSWTETLGATGDYAAIFAGWHHAETFPGVAELNAAYQDEFGRPADLLTGPAYACVQILADAIERAGTLDRDAIRDAVAATDMTTVIGPVTFNEDGTGNVLNPMSQWQNGELELVWPEDQASAPLAYPAIPFEERGEVATEPKPEAPECIEIGSSIPLTGKYGSLGAMVKPGYEFAVADINAAGGIYVEEYGVQIPVCLTLYDDESDPTKTVSKMETLFSDDNVVAYLGGAGGDMHAAAAPIAEKNKRPYLGIAFALYSIHQQGYQYLFSPFPKSPDQTRDVFEVLNTIPEDQRPSKVAIFQEKTDWGIECGTMWEQYAAEYGYEVVLHEEYAPGAGDFSAMILKAKDAEAEVLLTVPNPPDGLAMQKQMAELGWTPKFTLMIRAPENVSWTETLGATGDYATMFAGWHHAETYPGVAELNAKYQDEFGRPADLLTGPAYACVQLLVDAIERAGTLDPDAIRDALATADMTTVVGPVTFNEDGTGNVLNPLSQWQDGQLELVWPLDQASAELFYPATPFEDR